MIDKNFIVADVIFNHPETEKVFQNFGIRCFG